MAEDTGGLLGFLGRGYDPAAAYGGLLAEPSTEDAFKARALAAMAGAFGRGALPSPYKGGTPFLATLGQAAEAAYGGQDELIKARTQAAQASLYGTQADVAKQNLALNRGLLQARLDQLKAEEGAAGGGGLLSQGPAGLVKPSTAAGVSAPTGELADTARQIARDNGVPEEMFVHQIGGESGFNPKAKNDVGLGHAGIAQFDPPTAAKYGVDVNDPISSLNGAARYMADLYKQTGSWTGAMRGYAGVKTEGGLQRALAVPSYARAYELAKAADAPPSGGSGGGAAPGGPPAPGAPPIAPPGYEFAPLPNGGMGMRALPPGLVTAPAGERLPEEGPPPPVPTGGLINPPPGAAAPAPAAALPPGVPPVTSTPGGTNGIVPAGAPRPLLAQAGLPPAAPPPTPLVPSGGLINPGPPTPPGATAGAAPPMPVQSAPGTPAPALPGGAPTVQQILAAKRVAAIQEAMGKPVDPITAKIANFSIDAAQAGANAGQVAAAQQPYIQQNAAQAAQVKAQYDLWVKQNEPQLIRKGTTFKDPVSGKILQNPDEIKTVDKQGNEFLWHSYPSLTPGGTPTLVPIGQSKVGPGVEETLRATAGAQPITVGNQVTQQGPGYTQPMKSAAGTTIPSAADATPISGPKDYLADRAKDYAKVESEWGNGVGPAQTAINRTEAIMRAMKYYETGTFAAKTSEIVGMLKAVGIDLGNKVNDPAKAQEILKEAFGLGIDMMRSTGLSKWTQMELQGALKNSANPDLWASANHSIGAQTIGTLEWEQQMLKDYRAFKKYTPMADPQDFQQRWVEANPLQGFVDRAHERIGPLKGEPGAAPGGAGTYTHPDDGKTYPSRFVPDGKGGYKQQYLRPPQ